MTAVEIEALIKTKEERLADLKSGAIKCTIKEGDGRQEIDIYNTEREIRQLKTELAATQPKKEGK